MIVSRVLLTFVAFATLIGSAGAQVHLVVRPDGSKVIYNTYTPRSSKGPDYAWLAKQRDRKTQYDPVIQRHCENMGVDPVLAKAVIQVESGFHPGEVSNKGATGLMQLMPETARRFKVAKIFDPEENIRGGVEYLSALLRMFPNDLRKVLAAYNAGENAVLRYGGIPPYQETQLYVQKALTVYYGRPYGGSVSLLSGGFLPTKLVGGFRGGQPPVSRSRAARSVGRRDLLVASGGSGRQLLSSSLRER
ncbi:MAG: lytic transglycosylase domain-containing protein [Acidobacteriota bacterium]